MPRIHRGPAPPACAVWPQNWEWFRPDAAELTYASALNKSIEYVRAHVAAVARLGKPLVLEEFGFPRDLARHTAGSPTTWRDRYYADMLGEVARLAKGRTNLVGAGFWAWGGEARPRRPREPSEPLYGEHCWQAGDALLGDPPHEAAGWYSIYDADTSTHAVLANFSAALASLPE
jgi:mannan endo-1,4-beta-mannosidase